MHSLKARRPSRRLDPKLLESRAGVALVRHNGPLEESRRYEMWPFSVFRRHKYELRYRAARLMMLGKYTYSRKFMTRREVWLQHLPPDEK